MVRLKESSRTPPAPCCPASRSKPRAPAAACLSATSDESGDFRFPSVLPGIYEVSATLAGFKPAKVADVEVKLGSIKSVDFNLQLATRQRERHGHGGIADRRRQVERQVDQHPRRAGLAAAAQPRLHVAGHAGAGRQPRNQVGRHHDRRRGRGREPLRHRRHRDDRHRRRPLGQEPARRLRRRSPGQVDRLPGGIRRVDRRRHQRPDQERHQQRPRHRARSSTRARARRARTTRRCARCSAMPTRPNTTCIPRTTSQRFEPGGSIGGPILQNKMWFFGAYQPALHRHQAARRRRDQRHRRRRTRSNDRRTGSRCST